MKDQTDGARLIALAGGRPVASRSRNRASRATVDLVLKAAREVLVAKGYAGFTVRSVAEAANVSPGNVTYHFESKQDLLRALVNQEVENYVEMFRSVLTEVELDEKVGLETLVRLLWADTTSEGPMRAFREIWTIALHDAVVREAIDNLYDALMEAVAGLLRRFYPDSDHETLRESVQLLAIITEGASVLYGTRADRAVSQERMIDISVRSVDFVARGGRR